MNVRQSGTLQWDGAAFPVNLSVAAWAEGGWRPLALRATDTGFEGGETGLLVRLELQPEGDSRFRYRLSFTSPFPTRLQLSAGVPGIRDPFHLIPACIFGDNNLAGAEPGHFPNLTHRFAGNTSCSPYWEFRADRASQPVSMLLFPGGLVGVSADPYSAAEPHSSVEFIRNGVFADLGGDGKPAACGITLGYRNTPVTFINKDQWGPPTEQCATSGTVSGILFRQVAASRMAAHDALRLLYEGTHQSPALQWDPEDGIRALTDAFLTVNWQPDKEHFSNMRCIDPAKKVLTPWRTLAEVGWTGGGVIAYPLLRAGHHLGDMAAVERARYLLDWVARAYNPASGLLWDVCGKREGTQVNWWWSGYLVKDVHCSYTNASGVYYLLKAYDFLAHSGESAPEEWLDTACRVLDTLCALQLKDGSYGYTYSTTRRKIIDPVGFAGVYFAPAMALAFRHTSRQPYLDSARRAMAFYREQVRSICCCGTPMDTWKSPDQEGNLGFLRGAWHLHDITGEPEYLAMLEEGALYEYLWRYGFPARPEFPPLKGSPWSSVGGSVTSVSNPHIHPMGIFVSRELDTLAARTGSPYHRQRCQDGIDWALNTLSLYPRVSGYGQPGVLTERFCPSDGLTIETFPDGSPSSMWFSYNGWAAAAVLEGLVETVR